MAPAWSDSKSINLFVSALYVWVGSRSTQRKHFGFWFSPQTILYPQQDIAFIASQVLFIEPQDFPIPLCIDDDELLQRVLRKQTWWNFYWPRPHNTNWKCLWRCTKRLLTICSLILGVLRCKTSKGRGTAWKRHGDNQDHQPPQLRKGEPSFVLGIRDCKLQSLLCVWRWECKCPGRDKRSIFCLQVQFV